MLCSRQCCLCSLTSWRRRWWPVCPAWPWWTTRWTMTITLSMAKVCTCLAVFTWLWHTGKKCLCCPTSESTAVQFNFIHPFIHLYSLHWLFQLQACSIPLWLNKKSYVFCHFLCKLFNFPAFYCVILYLCGPIHISNFYLTFPFPSVLYTLLLDLPFPPLLTWVGRSNFDSLSLYIRLFRLSAIIVAILRICSDFFYPSSLLIYLFMYLSLSTCRFVCVLVCTPY